MNARLTLLSSLVLLLACATDRPDPSSRPAASGPTAATAGAPPATSLVAPEGIKLPRTFRPAAQRLVLEVVPSAAGFTGRTEIEGTLDAPTDVVWLKADTLKITAATAHLGGGEMQAEPVVREDERVALRFPRQLPAGPVTLALERFFSAPRGTRAASGG
jgi:hypothetical protein